MKFSISNIAWKAEWDKEVYQKLLDIGFSAIEIAPLRTLVNGYDSTIEEYDAWLKDYKVYFSEIASMQSLLFKLDIQLFESIENVEFVLNILKKGLIFASRLNVRTLVFGSPGIRNVHSNQEFENSKLFFRQLADLAQVYDIQIALEPNPTIYNTNFINTTLDALDYVKMINHSNFGINLDLGTVIENNELIHDIIDEEHFQWIKHVHISEPYLVPIKSDHSDLHIELLKCLNAVGYDRYVSIEMKSGLELHELFEILEYVKEKGITAGVLHEK